MKDIDVLCAVIRTLEKVSVRGKEDCDRMAGCIKALEAIEDAVNKDLEKQDSDNAGVPQEAPMDVPKEVTEGTDG